MITLSNISLLIWLQTKTSISGFNGRINICCVLIGANKFFIIGRRYSGRSNVHESTMKRDYFDLSV
jgi:hypothetical protein